MNNYPWLEAFLLALPGVTRDYKPECGFMNYRAAPAFRRDLHAGRAL